MPTHLLPQMPRRAEYLRNAICSPAMGTYAKMMM